VKRGMQAHQKVNGDIHSKPKELFLRRKSFDTKYSLKAIVGSCYCDIANLTPHT